MSADILTPGVQGPPDSGGSGPGFYGKLPAVGDFVTRRLPRTFVDPFDEWLQRAIAASREQLGQAWLGLYLTSPVWRGVMTPGVCGERGWMVVTAPSVDRVGRYFPLTIAAPAPSDRSPLDSAHGARGWFERAELALLDCLEARLALDAFDAQVQAVGPPPVLEPRPGEVYGGSTRAWRFGAPDGLDGPAPIIASAKALDQLMVSYSVWWSEGSDNVAPSLLVSAGLPPPEGYSSLLDGVFGRRGWADSGEVPAPGDEQRVVPPVGPPVRVPEQEQSPEPSPVLVVGTQALGENVPEVPEHVLVPPEPAQPQADSPQLQVAEPGGPDDFSDAAPYGEDAGGSVSTPADEPLSEAPFDPLQAEPCGQEAANDDTIGTSDAPQPPELDTGADTDNAFVESADEPLTLELPDSDELVRAKPSQEGVSSDEDQPQEERNDDRA